VVVAANRDRLVRNDGQAARHLADSLAGLGVSNLELRVSPTGDRDMSLSKVRSIFSVGSSIGQPDRCCGSSRILRPAKQLRAS
jgi:hypothetical protein